MDKAIGQISAIAHFDPDTGLSDQIADTETSADRCVEHIST
ncbi:MAG: hypothetical protein RQ736_07600 [Thiogranum sp.]|nr:hypothetical protein [Thiogranum sp.]